MFTEEQASEKNCVYESSIYPNNRTCAASKCMAWRWDVAANKEIEAVTGELEGMIGYCGLAGSP